MNKYIVEFLGTLALSFVIFATGNYLAIGSTLALIVAIGGPISSGAFNPAIAVALYSASDRNVRTPKDLAIYIAVQILGAVAGFYGYKQYMKSGK